MRLGWGRESDVSSGSQALKLIFWLLTRPKCDLGEVDKGMFQVAEWYLEVIFLTNPKYEFFEVEKAPLKVVEWHFELIFFLLTSPKLNSDEVEKKRCFMCSHCTLKSFYASWPALNATSVR